jgi:DNA-binding NarL/FixJ family response regulator
MTPLVGRDSELATLLTAVDRARQGVATVVVVDGDAGVGKTRVLAELVDAAAERGVLTLIGHCVDLGDVPPPYLPFTEAFGRLLNERPELVDAMLAAHPSISRLLPRHVPTDRDVEDRVDRGEFFEAILGALTTPTDAQPVLLIVEDVHWADQATRDLLGYLFTRLDTQRVAVIASFRSDDLHRRHPLRPTLAQWARLTTVDRLHLDPLGTDDLRTLVRSLHPAPLAEPDMRSIVTRADGNAFFAEELVAASAQYADSQQLPWQLADLLLVRLDRLPDAAREVVQVAAVGGRRISHDMLVSVLDVPSASLEAALRDAVDAHILEPTPSGRGYTFRHALLAEAVYDDLLPGERVRMHAAYATELAKRPDSNAAELARHARASHDLATAYEASVQAGDEAMAIAAPQEAMNHYQAALEVAPMAASAPSDPAPLVLALVDAAVAAGWSYRGLRLAREAIADLPPDAPAATRAQLLYAFAFAAVAGETDDAPFNATAEALRLVPADPPTAFRARLAALHARGALIMGREVEAQRWGREAIDIATAIGKPGASTDAATTLAILERRADEPGAVAERLVVIAGEARDAGETAVELRTRYNVGSLYYELGDLGAAEDAYAEASRRARESGRPWAAYGMEARSMVGLIQYQRGDWDAAAQTLDIAGESATTQAEALFAGTSLLIRAGRGDASALDMLPLLRPWWERDGRIGLLAATAALEIHEQAGRPDDALAMLDTTVAVLTNIWQEPWFLARIRLSAMGLAALSSGVATATAAERSTLVARGAVLVSDGRASAARGLPKGRKLGIEGLAWLDRLEAEWARLRWLAGHDAPDGADLVAVWQQTVDRFGYGNVVEQARSRARLATVLRAAGHAPQAAVEADSAREVARALRAEPLLAEIRALGLTRAGARDSDGLGQHSLTSRERDVLSLVVEGRTNRQIAGQLYISEKTVSVHVSNILAKLGVGSRTEAAAVARRDGLLS